MTSRPDLRSLLQATFGDWRWVWLLLLLPVALFLPALPIDETRYLSVAWEMRLHGEFLVPHLNGATYSEKPPLLFWLINIAWTILGINVWSVRLGVLAASFASIILFGHLVRRLDPDPQLARRATLIFMSMIFFALFSSAIMFDVLLTTWVLIALHGAVDLDAQRWRRGTLLFAIGFGLGILTKGPVVLLDGAMAVAFAPWWSQTARQFKGRWYGCLGLAVLGGAVIALAWAIPAAIAGGPDYANSIFLHQTVDRMTKSFAHRRPLWWYFAVVPFMVLPWTIVMRASWSTWRDSFHISKSVRFALAWGAPAFVAFCLVSGKQPHYLLPLLGSIALYFATVLGCEASRVDGLLFGLVLLVVGVAFAALPLVTSHAIAHPDPTDWIHRHLTDASLAVFATTWIAWGIGMIAVAIALLSTPRIRQSLHGIALSGVAVAALAVLCLAQMIGPTIDVSAAAQKIKQYQSEGRPVAHLAWHHGLFEFAGRLTQPLPSVTFHDLHEWCVKHPDGEIVTIYTKYPIPAKPELEMPYRFGHITFWRAADIIPVEILPAPKADEDDSPDD
ncbi:MAG: glycosyltransferase family 39 protein [Rudaea sp.]